MTGNFSYAAGVNSRTKPVKKTDKGLKRIAAFAGIVLAAELIWLLGISPSIPFTTVEVHGFRGFDRSEILACAGINDRASFISTNVKEVQKRLAAHNLVESARVTKRFPDRLTIILVPRRAVVVALASAGAGQLPLYIDRHGVIMKMGGDVEANDLPVLSGLVFENPQAGMQLPESLLPLLESISGIAGVSPELLTAISEIHVEKRAWDGLELVLYPVHSSIRVRVENNISGDVIRYILLVLDVLESRNPKPEEIDFRSGLGSYKIKETSLW
ncbi:MAG: FtsQ-type POTRA domain-containing protein [Treponema sp.]|jgi:cell division protein FtsQ|nr:FtsQ-type POTRA domain-containing protein [Treponema sp.]